MSKNRIDLPEQKNNYDQKEIEDTNQISQQLESKEEENLEDNELLMNDSGFFCKISFDDIFNTVIIKKKNQLTKEKMIPSFEKKDLTDELQKIIMNASGDEIKIILDELTGSFRSSIKSKYGNYFMIDLFKVCNNEQRKKILTEIQDYISTDCSNKYSFHAIQSFIELTSTEDCYKLILHSFYDEKLLLFNSFDPNGSYVIQKIISHIPEKFRKDFNMLFIKIFTLISTKKYGICCANKFIACTKDEQ